MLDAAIQSALIACHDEIVEKGITGNRKLLQELALRVERQHERYQNLCVEHFA